MDKKNICLKFGMFAILSVLIFLSGCGTENVDSIKNASNAFNPEDIEKYLLQLKDENKDKRIKAASSLGTICRSRDSDNYDKPRPGLEDVRKVVAALTASLKDSDALVRQAAINAISKIDRDVAKTAIPSLLETLKHDNNGDVRWAVVFILGKLNDDTVAPVLIEVLEQDANEDVRECAATILVFFGDIAVPALIRVAQHDDNPNIRSVAVSSLGKILNNSAMPVIIKALVDDPASDVRICAAVALGGFNDPKIIPALVKVMNNQEEEDVVRKCAVYSLGKLRAVPELINAARSKKVIMRCEAVSALGDIGDKSAIPVLENSLYDEDDDAVRHRAAEALSKLGGEGIASLIHSLNKKNKKEVYKRIVYHLKKVTDQDFGTDAAKWREWWKANKDRILKEEAEKAKAEKAKE